MEKNMIFLAIVEPTSCQEYHIKWEGHTTVETAKAELFELRSRLIADHKYPYDAYVYENDIPLYGNKAYTVDDVDFNFYGEK
jgi:hypothetical protein